MSLFVRGLLVFFALFCAFTLRIFIFLSISKTIHTENLGFFFMPLSA